ncbi:MAG: prepilin-type N-terminal cleavage/methylation domain-containing protein [Armatimonadota bacterium]
MKGRKGFTLIELLVVIAIIAILAAILFPVFAKARRTAQASNCESNMKQIGNGLKMYLSDWEDTYPTNRLTNVSSFPMSTEVPLSINTTSGIYGDVGTPKINSSTGKPYRFVGPSAGSSVVPNPNGRGPNWIEALYNYIETVTKLSDPTSIWKCQSAAPVGRKNASFNCVSYAFNANMLEVGEGAVKNAGNLMMVRELDGYQYATIRPTNISRDGVTNPPGGSSNGENAQPNFPFLSSPDGYTYTNPAPNYKLHGVGSHILFADGHVKLIPLGVFTKDPDCYRCSGTNTDDDGVWFESEDKRIAITPD